MIKTHPRKPLATVDVNRLNSLRWGPIRQLFPAFVEDIELGRYLKKLLACEKCGAVQIQPHLPRLEPYRPMYWTFFWSRNERTAAPRPEWLGRSATFNEVGAD